MILILLGAASLSLAHWILLKEEPYPFDFIIIAFIVILNAFMGFVQEYKAEQAMEALKEMSAPEARVLRGGEVVAISARDVVPGDIYLVEAGDKLTADLRIISDVELYADESLLTGESLPVNKSCQIKSPDAVMADRTNMLFSGTVVTAGRGKAIAVATGMQTEMGKIAEMIKESKQEPTPLQKEMDILGKSLGEIILVITLVTIGAALMIQETYTVSPVLSLVLFGVALAVAAIPEGLPAIVTISLALGVKRMATRKAIVRKLAAVETLGSTSIICSDKTGTITMNELKVVSVVPAVEIAGVKNSDRSNGDGSGQATDEMIINCSVLCNNAAELGIGADPVETALVRYAESSGRRVLDILTEYPRIAELPFSSEKKFMLTGHIAESGGKDREKGHLVFAKGAPEMLLSFCSSIKTAGDLAINGIDLTNMSDEELGNVIDRVRVFSRVEPSQKLRIVELLQKRERYLVIFGASLPFLSPPIAERC